MIRLADDSATRRERNLDRPKLRALEGSEGRCCRVVHVRACHFPLASREIDGLPRDTIDRCRGPSFPVSLLTLTAAKRNDYSTEEGEKKNRRVNQLSPIFISYARIDEIMNLMRGR